MVRTTNDVLDINPLERMDKLEEIGTEKRNTIATKKKELEELEKTKKKEIEELDQKKKKDVEEIEKKKQKELDNLDQKRKELQELEKKKVQEIEETEELIDKSFQELIRHKRIIIQEEEEKEGKRKKGNEVTLEEVAEKAPNIAPKNDVNYNKFFENLQAPQRLYDVANRSFYDGLTELRNKAANGQITPDEERFIDTLKSQIERFNQNSDYKEKDENQYMKRSMNIIGQIDKYQRLKVD